MRKILLVLLFLFMLSPLAYSVPGAVRCGKLLDVRSGQMLNDRRVVFDASGYDHLSQLIVFYEAPERRHRD